AEHPDSPTKRPAEGKPGQVCQAIRKGSEGGTGAHTQGGEPQTGAVQDDVQPGKTKKGAVVGNDCRHVLAVGLVPWKRFLEGPGKGRRGHVTLRRALDKSYCRFDWRSAHPLEIPR